MKILFFDGYCTLCNGLVDFLIKQDRHRRIHFASLQGETAKKILPQSQLKSLHDPETVLYFHDDRIEERSTAVLKCLNDLGGPLGLASRLAFVIPRGLRDLIYRWVARNRIRFFGRRETCRVPTAAEKEQLLP